MTRGLVGRDALLSAAMTSVDAAFAGSGGLLLLSGEPGIGKTALLGELAAAACRRGARQLRGTCWAGGGVPAYWPWTLALRGLASDGAGFGEAERLVNADPDGSLQDAGADAAADARFRLFDAVAARLVKLAAAHPVIVMLDDLQWADQPSLRLLDFVVRQSDTHRLLVLGAYRDDEAGPAVRALSEIGRLLPVGGISHTDVPALMTAVAGPAAANVPGSRLAERIWRRAGGNPFLVGELTRLLLARGGWADLGGADVPIPDTVRDTLDRRIARLSQPCVSVLTVAALVGPLVRPDLVDVVLGHPGATADVLGEAVDARVLTVDSGGHAFAHDLFREALAESLPAGRRRELHLTLGRILEQRRTAGAEVGAAELAAHFLAAGVSVAADAVRYATAAAREATARLGHEEACRHYQEALAAHEMLDDPGDARRTTLLLELAAARDRSGHADAARTGFEQAADLARREGDPVALARAAIGAHGLGSRSGTTRRATTDLLREAAAALSVAAAEADPPGCPAPPIPALRSRVLACLSRELRHGRFGRPPEPALRAAEEAVSLARAAGDPAGVAVALLALHDAKWEPGSARARLQILAHVQEAAEQVGDRELVAQTSQLRATALLELGDPTAQRELAAYAVVADELGHARGRWFALTRRATLAVLAGRVPEAADLARRGLELGRAIGQVDAAGAFGTLNASLGLFGHPPAGLDSATFEADPLQPVIPMLQAWVLVASGRADEARPVFTGFAAELVPDKHDLEMVSIFAAVAAAVGTVRQREAAYQRLLPHAGTHVVVGGCASYNGAVDHHLGLLASALDRPADAGTHLAAAVRMYERLGVEAWTALTRAAMRDVDTRAANVLRRDGAVWTLVYSGVAAHLPDIKGLHDLAVLLAAPGRPVHVNTLLGRTGPPTGADPVLDDQALRAYRERLAQLDGVLDTAASIDEHDRVASERAALIKELITATGMGGRSRRLGDETERARKTVTARIRDALRRIDREHPELGVHLRASVSTGTSCIYAPPEPTRWSSHPR